MSDVWELSTMERRYSVPPSTVSEQRPGASEDLHAWSIYRQNLNSDFTDSALGSSEKSPLPYGNFQLRESTVQSILSHPRYGPKSELGTNMYTYLKFGLPRVFPPTRGPRDGSSGYDSSDDASPYLRRRGRYLRSKSDPDFRAHHGTPAWVRVKSNSEANLLSSEAYYHRSAHDLREVHPRPRSKAGSHVSNHEAKPATMYARDTVLLNDKYFPKDAFYAEGASMKQPHLQIRGLHVERAGRKILQEVTFEVQGGEIMAIISTSEDEGTALLDVLADRHGTRIRGDLLLNAHPVRPHTLRDRVSYVQQESCFSDDMSVRQTLLLHDWLRRPGTIANKLDTQGRIEALIEDLGLAQVKNTRVSGLTTSERQRLNVACHLLLDTDLLLLDQPTNGMDIFDTFFLVEFLRQWAARGRIVLLTIHPPTYEIFTMVSRVALLSTGRTMFCGRRRDMLPYFAFIQYPCPAYKNPSDYYLDLVTLDDLSAEAMLESSQRIEQLAEIFKRRQEPLTDPGPAASGLPPKIKHANFFLQMLVLLIRVLVYTYPANLIRCVERVLAACFLSVAVGTVFWDLQSAQQEQFLLNDRLGYHHTVCCVALWPLFLHAVADVTRCRPAVTRDLSDRLYSRLAYILTKIIYTLPASVIIGLAYIIPSYAMTGVYLEFEDGRAFYVYVGYMLVYLVSVLMTGTALAYMVTSKHLAAMLGGLLLTCMALAAGYVVHTQDLGVWCSWVQWASPVRWTLQPIVTQEFNHLRTLMCRNKQVQHQDIIVQLPCPIMNGTAALVFMDYYNIYPTHIPILATMATWLLSAIGAIFFFFVCRHKRKQSRNNTTKP